MMAKTTHCAREACHKSQIVVDQDDGPSCEEALTTDRLVQTSLLVSMLGRPTLRPTRLRADIATVGQAAQVHPFVKFGIVWWNKGYGLDEPMNRRWRAVTNHGHERGKDCVCLHDLADTMSGQNSSSREITRCGYFAGS
jgi:hypothetical protein